MLATCEKLFKYFKDHDSGSKTVGNHSVEMVKLDDRTVARFKYFGNTILSINLRDHCLITGNYLSDCGWNTVSTKRALRSYIELIANAYTNKTLKLFEVDNEYAQRLINQLTA